MATTVSASLQVPSVAAIPQPSHTKPWKLQINFQGVADNTLLSAVVGVAASPPTVYTDLGNPVGPLVPSGATSLTMIERLTSPFDYSGQMAFDMAAYAAATVGNHVWVCLFDSVSPSGSDPISAKAGPFILAA